MNGEERDQHVDDAEHGNDGDERPGDEGEPTEEFDGADGPSRQAGRRHADLLKHTDEAVMPLAAEKLRIAVINESEAENQTKR